MPHVIVVDSLTKRYGETKAVQGISFTVEKAKFSGLSVRTEPVRPQPLRFWKDCGKEIPETCTYSAMTPARNLTAIN